MSDSIAFQRLNDVVLSLTGAAKIISVETIQSLWSGYGHISRVTLTGAEHSSVVVKHIQLPENIIHPRGWNTDFSHIRKLTSYQIERHWYRDYAHVCDPSCPVPQFLGVDTQEEGDSLIVLTDLADTGFSKVKAIYSDVPNNPTDEDWHDIRACIHWLAHFHGTFMSVAPDGLWRNGSYWHLKTRPDELEALSDVRLKRGAGAIDDALRSAKYQTLIHGDAKLANFCFASDDSLTPSSTVAAVDFQYPGGGVGVQDLAYFLSSCLNEEDLMRYESPILDDYFTTLSKAVCLRHPGMDVIELEKEWRGLYDVAWADFYRFLKGWKPDHWKLNAYSERLTRGVLDRLLA